MQIAGRNPYVEHEHYGRQFKCEACGERYCDACVNRAAHTDHVICGACRERGVEECVGCWAIRDPERMSVEESAEFAETSYCLACARTKAMVRS